MQSRPAENSLDAVVKVVNIRYNGGSEVLEKSSMLKEYAAFIEAYTDKIHKGVDESVAIGKTLKEFIADGSILTGFLRKHEKEVDIMLSGITKEEYGYLRHQEGLEQGFEMGMEEQKCHIIRHMVEQGYDSEKIAELTGFDADEVEKYM